MSDTLPPEQPVAMPPVEAAPAAPVIPEPKPTFQGPCAGCQREVVVYEKSWYPQGPNDFDSKIVCVSCIAIKRSSDAVVERERELKHILVGRMVLVDKVLPAIRAKDLGAQYVTLDYCGAIRVKAVDRENGMALAGALGFLLEDAHRWKKSQEYNEASFQLSGRVATSGEFADITITNVAPSSSCRVVTDEIDVPARKEKRVRIVCNEADEAPLS